MSRRVGIALGLMAGLAAFGAASAWLLRPGDPIAGAEAAERRGDWARVVAQSEVRLKARPNDPKALLLRARGLARLGRSADARPAYLAAGAEAMTAEDFRLLAELLIHDGRDASGWLALEAAGRIDPKDDRVRSAMTRLHGLVGSQRAVAHTTELLSSVPTGPALGELVVGLAALTGSDASDDPILDRVSMRDRATLRALDSPTAVRLLFARVLLEAGRTAEARERLEGVLASGPDPEASWLLSRVLLRQGDDDGADAALAAAGDFARDRRADHEPASYVGARSCRECHSEIYDQQQGSRHATTIHHGADMARVKIPDGPVADPVDPKVKHVFARDGDAVRLETTVADKTYRAILDYALGSGHRGVTMVGKDEAGGYRELRISEYSERGTTWDVTSGFSPHPSDPSEYLGKGLSPSGFRDCLHCHATRYRSPHDRSGPEALDRGIGCERCHGPGGNHAPAIRSGFAEPAIGRPKGATGPQRMKICAECHASDGTFAPSHPQYIRFQSSTMPNSKCFTQSQGKLDCLTCHDPHKKMETSAAHYESKCLSCHGTKAEATAAEFRRVPCPVNPARDCLKCHMPTVDEVVPHTSFTDHHIRVHREEEAR